MKPLFTLLPITILCLAFWGCQNKQTDEENSPFEIVDLEADEALKLVQSGEVAVLDVRTQGEWDAGHIENAVHCDISDPAFEANMAKIDYSKPYVVH